MSFCKTILETLPDTRLLKGDVRTAYRDPAVTFHDGVFHLFLTLVENEPQEGIFMYLAKTTTRNFRDFSPVRKLTSRDKRLNYSSPGNVFRFHGKFWICIQTYCRENGEIFGNDNCRIYTSTSDDLETWSEPALMHVKGDDLPPEEMGRMIDPFCFFDIQDNSKIWCFFKQNGISRAWTRDMCHWHYEGHINGGENSCVVNEQGIYYVWSSPANGIALHTGSDLELLKDTGTLITLGQNHWNWARGRLTAGFVLDLRKNPDIGMALLFYHGTGPKKEPIVFDNFASIGIAWSRDLETWKYPESTN